MFKMNVNPHHLLDLFENIHEKYKLQENDYKVFVEALGGKREAIDFENAKFVEISCDEYSTSFNEEKDVEEVYCVPNVKKILRIVGDIENPNPVGSPARHINWMDDVKYFLDKQNTTMDRYQLQILSTRYARSSQHENFHINCTRKLTYGESFDDAYLVHVKSINVLE